MVKVPDGGCTGATSLPLALSFNGEAEPNPVNIGGNISIIYICIYLHMGFDNMLKNMPSITLLVMDGNQDIRISG